MKLRMAHRILSQSPYSAAPSFGIKTNHKLIKEQRLRIKAAPIIICDNVEEYFSSNIDTLHHPSEFAFDWIPNAAPPYSDAFFEYTTTHGGNILQFGALVTSLDTSQWTEALPEECTKNIAEGARWILFVEPWLTGTDGTVSATGILLGISVSATGQIVKSYILSGQLAPDITSSLIYSVSVILLAISFCHCKNVARTDSTESHGPSAKWRRRQRMPRLRYTTLAIDPMKERVEQAAHEHRTDHRTALHICRGHFATYSEDKPLFGKYTGTFFRPIHVRGHKSAGEVVKTYSIKGFD